MPSRASAVTTAGRPLPVRFAALTAGCTRRLPWRLGGFVPPDMVGYGLLGGVTFVVDIVLLVLLDWLTPIPVAVSVVLADVVAWALHYALNRVLNFQSHAPVGPEAVRYTIVLLAGLAISAGLTTGIAALGVHLAIARVAAGAVIAVLGYVACRWWVFPAPPPPPV